MNSTFAYLMSRWAFFMLYFQLHANNMQEVRAQCWRITMRFAVLCVLVLLSFSSLSAAERQHPYLFFSKKDIPAIKAKLKDPFLSSHFSRVCQRAMDYDLNGKKVLCAGIAFHLTGEKRYAEQGIKDMHAVLKRGPWFQKGAAVNHCSLATAKKTLPIAYGYDLFYNVMSESDRKTFEREIGRNVFKPFLEAHANHNEAGRFFTDSKGNKTYWTQCYFNWNQWINGDIGLMGLAMYDHHPDAKKVVEAARASLRYTHPEFNQGASESGGWDEGVMYWGGSMKHSIHFYAALENVLGTDDGFFDLPGVKMTTQYGLDFTGPDGKWVPFADCNNRAVIDPPSEFYYLSKKYKRELDMAYPECYIDKHHPMPFAILWRPPGKKVSLPPKRKVAWYKDIHWAYLTNGPTQLAFKGGDLTANHGQNDANSLIVYVGDELMLHDPGYGPKDTKSHNTLILNNSGQSKRSNGTNRYYGGYSDSVAEIEMCNEVEGGHVYLVSNATDCYTGLKTFRRHVILTKEGIVVVFDEIVASTPSSMKLQWIPERSQQSNENGALFSGQKHALMIAADADQSVDINGSGKMLSIASSGKIPSLRAVTVMVPDYKKAVKIDASYSGSKVDISFLNKSFTFKMTKAGYQYDAKAKAVAKKSKKSTKERTKRKRGSVAAKPKKESSTSVDVETLATWSARLRTSLEAQLAKKKKPYFQFMNKEYQVKSLSTSGTIQMVAGSQDIAYPFSRLKPKDQSSLAQGLMEVGGEEERLLAVFFMKANKQSSAAQKIETKLSKASRDELAAIFK